MSGAGSVAGSLAAFTASAAAALAGAVGETVQVALPEGDRSAGLDLGGGGQGGGEVQVTILRSAAQGLGDDSLTEQFGLREVEDGGPQGGLRERLGEEGLGFWQPLCRPGKGADTGKGAAFTSGGEPEAGLETTGGRQFAVSDGCPLGEPVAVVGIEVGFAEPFLGRGGMLWEGGKLALQPGDELDGLTSGTRVKRVSIESAVTTPTVVPFTTLGAFPNSWRTSRSRKFSSNVSVDLAYRFASTSIASRSVSL